MEAGRGGPRVAKPPEGTQNRRWAGTARSHRRPEVRPVTGADSGQIVLLPPSGRNRDVRFTRDHLHLDLRPPERRA